MTEHEALTLWLGAFRYYCGRRTYAVSDFCNLLLLKWATLPAETRNLIRRDLAEEIQRDDEARERGGYKPLGDDCDRDEWMRVWARIK